MRGKRVTRGRWSLFCCACAADAPPRTCGPDYHLRARCSAQLGNAASTLSKPPKDLWRTGVKNPRKGLSNSLLALRTPSFFLIHLCVNTWLKRWQGAGVREVSDCCGAGRVVLCRMHASGSHLKKCSPFPWINEQLGRTGQGGAICKCHRHCLLILHIIKANIPNLYQSNQEQAITATGAPGEPRPNSGRREQGGRERERERERERDRVHSLSIWHTHTHTHTHDSEHFYKPTHMLTQTRRTPSNNKQTHEISTNTTSLIASAFNNRAEWKRDQLYIYLWAVCMEPKWESCYSFPSVLWRSQS